MENNACETFGIPEKLVDVVVADDVCVIPFPSDVLAVLELVALVTEEFVERLDDGVKVEALGYGFNAVLALGRSIVFVGALEDEAEAFWHKSDVGGLTPTQKEEGDLSNAVVGAHVVHCLTPSVECAIERLFAGALGCGTASNGLEALKAGVIDMADGIIEVELRGKVPFAVVGVGSTTVVCMAGEEGLFGRHSGSATVEEIHEEVELGVWYDQW